LWRIGRQHRDGVGRLVCGDGEWREVWAGRRALWEGPQGTDDRRERGRVVERGDRIWREGGP